MKGGLVVDFMAMERETGRRRVSRARCAVAAHAYRKCVDTDVIHAGELHVVPGLSLLRFPEDESTEDRPTRKRFEDTSHDRGGTFSVTKNMTTGSHLEKSTHIYDVGR